MIKRTKKGYITITLVLSVGIAILGGIATFYNVKGNTDKEIAQIKTDVALNERDIQYISKDIQEIRDGQLLLLRKFNLIE